MRLLLGVPALALLIGCTSPAEISKQPFETEFRLDRNYQAVYADILRGAKNCLNPGFMMMPGMSTFSVDGQLYSELGYGEVSTGITGSIPMTTGTARVEKDGDGALVRIRTANGIPSARASTRDSLSSWARGEKMCDQ